MSPGTFALLEGVSVADIARALRRSGFAISNGPVSNVFIIKRAPVRFTDAKVIDLAQELPALIRRQAGPIHDFPGVDYATEPNDAA
jgi:hypothetical protein